MTDARLKKVLSGLKPFLEASLDPICVVDAAGKIAYVNLGMKNLLSLRGSDLKKGIEFCSTIKFAACQTECQIKHALSSSRPLRLDETPAQRGGEKLRVALKAVPLRDPEGEAPGAIGAIIVLRDTTGEVILQAKYHKLMHVVGEKDLQIAELEGRIEKLQAVLRRARQYLVA
jgi:transcriptional regulator with PAS, ATPase and Fis domain